VVQNGMAIVIGDPLMQIGTDMLQVLVPHHNIGSLLSSQKMHPLDHHGIIRAHIVTTVIVVTMIEIR